MRASTVRSRFLDRCGDSLGVEISCASSAHFRTESHNDGGGAVLRAVCVCPPNKDPQFCNRQLGLVCNAALRVTFNYCSSYEPPGRPY